MKKLFLVFLFIFSASLMAKPSYNIMHCLGKEEAKFHLNDKTNHTYNLNQHVISFLMKITNYKMKRSYAKQVCQSPKPTLTTINLIFSAGRKVFVSRNLIDYKSHWSDLFIKVINHYQSIAPKANCLTKKIPLLNKVNEQIYYNSDLFSLYSILIKKKRAQKIIQKLVNESRYILNSC